MTYAAVRTYLEQFTALLQDELGDNLSGVYLHGSLAMGCFNPLRSDIDFIVVVREQMAVITLKQILRKVLSLHDEMPHGLEFSVVLEAHLNPYVYPTPVELHYSDYHRERYQSDDDYLCGAYEDEDFAAQLAVAYHKGVPLYGQPLNELYPPVEKEHYLASILYDINGASSEIIENPMYITLNLCRVLFYIRDNKLASKREGGEWGVRNLPAKYQNLIQFHLDEYNGSQVRDKYDQRQLADFADYMLKAIHSELG